MLTDQGSIPQDTLQSQDRDSIWGTFAFVPKDEPSTCNASLLTICGNSLPRAHSCPPSEGTPKLSRTTAILLVFQADGKHERITDVYRGLIVHRVKLCLYTSDQILVFIKDIEVNLKAVCNTLKAGVTPARGVPFASLSATMGAPCPSSQTHLTALFTPRAT